MKREIRLMLMCTLLLFAGLALAPVQAQQVALPSSKSGLARSSAAGSGAVQPTVVQAQSIGSQTQAANGNAEDILLIQTSPPWNSAADTTVLDSLGYSYRLATWSDISSNAVDIFAYPVVLIVNDQVQAFYDEYAARVADFESYVSSGHTLVFFAASDGWAAGSLQASLPGGVRVTTPWYEERNYITSADHPVVTAQLSDGNPLTDADLSNNYCSHGYFSNLLPDTTTILQESHGYPTLIEYRLGGGRVIASTQTWEYSWDNYSYGPYSRKALDDVFLYAFSGGATALDIRLNLRIDDADPRLSVNKSRGSYVDVVATLSGKDAYAAGVKIQVPGNKLGTPVKTFTRTLPGDATYEQENQYTNLGGGSYEISSTLQLIADQRFYRELVWRFKVPDGATPERGILISGTMSAPGYGVRNADGAAKLNIVDYARSVIVTNRQRLFAKYRPKPSQDDVSPLLAEVYRQAALNQGEVFYIDLYNDAARDWSQNVDYTSETTANSVAQAIDGLIEGWYNRLTRRPAQQEPIKPEYLLIVGDDAIVPFQRAHAVDYDDGDEHTVPSSCPSPDPVLDTLCHDYIFSDNLYADVGGGKSDWETGKLELSAGRIVGYDASDMRRFIEGAAFKIAPLRAAVLASLDGSQADGMQGKLEALHANITGLKDPDMVDNNDWTRQQWLDAWQGNWQLNYYGGHGDPFDVPGTGNWDQAANLGDLSPGRIAENHPLFVSDACDLGVPAGVSVMHHLTKLGMGGMVASTGISSFTPNFGPLKTQAYGEALVNNYVDQLIDTGSWFGLVPPTGYSASFGTALLKAKQNYSPMGLFGFNKTDKKTMLEFVYYGLPWSFTATPNNQAVQAQRAAHTARGYTMAAAGPSLMAQGGYSMTFSASVPSYQLVATGPFELLSIPGADALYTYHEPVLPVLNQTFSLPPGSTVSGIDLVSEHAVALGAHNIPAADPPTQYHPTSGYTGVMSVSGVYPPAPRYRYDVVDQGDHVEVRVAIVPATFDTGTHQVTLYDSTVVRVNYNAPMPIVISDLALDKPQYQVGETMTTTASIQNVGSDSLTLTPQIDVYDANGAIAASSTGSPFTIAGGGSHLLQMPSTPSLDPSHYHMILSLQQNGVNQGAASRSFDMLAGKLTAFDAPAFIGYTEYGAFNLDFANYRMAPVVAKAKIYLYDDHGSEIASLLQRTLTIDAQSAGTFSWSWTPTGMPEGTYHVRSVVQVGDEVYTSDTVDITLSTVQVAPAETERWADPGTSIAYTVQVTNTGAVPAAYTIDVGGNAWPTAAAKTTTESLPPGATASVDVTVTVPPGAAGYTSDTATLGVTAVGGTRTATSLLTTYANPTHGLTISVPTAARMGARGADVIYHLTVLNTGNVADSFLVTAAGQSWSAVAPERVGPIAPGSSAALDVTVTIPAGAAPGATDTATITVISQANPARTRTVQLTTKAVAQVYLPLLRAR